MDEKPLILGIETATLQGSVCVARGETILASLVGDARESHSNTLLRDINELLGQAEIALSEIELFAAAIGPGSFTGLRIGLATTKALAATLNRPCVAVPTLNAVANALGPRENAVALLPAGRGEVFAQLFSVGSQGHVHEVDAPAHLTPQKLLVRYQSLHNIAWAGPAAEIHRNLIEDYAKNHSLEWTVVPFKPNLAQQVVTLAFEQFRSGVFVTPELLKALYVRPSDAELKANVVNH